MGTRKPRICRSLGAPAQALQTERPASAEGSQWSLVIRTLGEDSAPKTLMTNDQGLMTFFFPPTTDNQLLKKEDRPAQRNESREHSPEERDRDWVGQRLFTRWTMATRLCAHVSAGRKTGLPPAGSHASYAQKGTLPLWDHHRTNTRFLPSPCRLRDSHPSGGVNPAVCAVAAVGQTQSARRLVPAG
jgi:hypothetical protein